MPIITRSAALFAAFAALPAIFPVASSGAEAFALPGQDRHISSAVTEASAALSAALSASDRFGTPVVSAQLLENTQCVIGMRVTRGALGVGGQGGEGLMSCRLPARGFSAPSFIRTGGFDFSVAIGIDVMDIAIFITDPSEAERYKSQFNFSTRAYVRAVAASASAAIDAANRYGMAVVQTNRAGLFAGVGITLSSLSHMPARNEIVYGNILGGGDRTGGSGVPTDVSGRLCSSYVLEVRRNSCIARYRDRVGGGERATSSAILSLPGFQAPAVTQPFVRMLENNVR